jgi:hypothetical protein
VGKELIHSAPAHHVTAEEELELPVHRAAEPRTWREATVVATSIKSAVATEGSDFRRLKQVVDILRLKL